jgi:aryl-alcohol dehydrogenase-like predicted oxidoreductase
VSAVALGTWLTWGGHLHDRTALAIMRRAFDAGINFIDTADVYALGAAETQLGTVLADVPRKDYVLASKVFFPTADGPNDRGLSRKHVFETVHASLGRLKTDYLDLLQCHRFDEETPLEETVGAFHDLIRQGKIHYWGVSCWTGPQIDRAVLLSRELNGPPPVTNQPPYNLLAREIEEEVVPTCKRLAVGTLPFSPLAQGVLTGKYLGGTKPHDSRLADDKRNKFMGRYLGDEATDRVARLKELAVGLGISPAQLSLAWLLHQDTVCSVIVGATKTGQLDENCAAADVELDAGVLQALNDLFA